MVDISKRFGAVCALRDVSFAARPGTVHALCGENGAGKSVLSKILAGVYRPDSGRIEVQGREVAFSSPAEAVRAGISMLYQESDLAPDLTVAENIFAGQIEKFSTFGVVNMRKMIAEAQKLRSAHEQDRRQAAATPIRHLVHPPFALELSSPPGSRHLEALVDADGIAVGHAGDEVGDLEVRTVLIM